MTSSTRTTPSTDDGIVVPNPEILERNLAAIRVRSPQAALAIESADADASIQFLRSPDGEVVAIHDGRAMCSKRQPSREASTWAEQYDPQHCGFIGILGFGLGYHVRALQQAHGKLSLLLCYEPDVGMLRAVLERVDHSEWIQDSLFVLSTTTDASTIGHLISGAEAFLSTGVELASHPGSKKRLGDRASAFSSNFLDVVRSTRTHLVTVLAHSGVTLRNILMNTGVYASRSGIIPLKDSCAGKAAILVAAGPSLQRNLHLLEDPSIRDRFVIIAVQTMLKPLLERGIKPHFVTALDHHEISKRFYEGLTTEDVDGVRLVVEPKANAAIVDAFPGEIVCAGEPQLDLLLGDELSREMGTLPSGATVAHLNYYLARYLGCTTAILIGQDLGFTDGQYYASGASIHRVWAGELSEHRTLEMFEWERIMRMKNLLRKRTDVQGRPIYTDEQMSTYIAQFESDFQQDAALNPNNPDHQPMRIINATQGGVHIRNTEVMTLCDAIQEFGSLEQIDLPLTPSELMNDDQHARDVRSRVELIIRQLTSIHRLSERTIELINKAQEHIDDPATVDRCIRQIHTIRDDVTASEPGFGLVNFINQKGALNRFRVDRQISLIKDLDESERQIKQLDRDAHNVQWVKGSALEVKNLVERVLAVLDGTQPPMTRDEFAHEQIEMGSQDQSAQSHQPAQRVEAVIFADPEFGPLGIARPLGQPIHEGLNALELTIQRLTRTSTIDGITIVSPDPESIRMMSIDAQTIPVRVVGVDAQQYRQRSAVIGQARFASSECWRGSIGSMSCYDEGLDPAVLSALMVEHHIDACAVVGSDWAMVDPVLVDQIVSQYRGDPSRCRVPFSQAVPGIGCCVLDADAVDSLARAASASGVLGSVGAMLSYIPIGPQSDPIASPLCVGVDLAARDAGVRVIADTPVRANAMASAYRGLGSYASNAETKVLMQAYTNELALAQNNAPSRIELEITNAPRSGGVWAFHNQHTDPMNRMSIQHAELICSQARTLRPDCSVLIHGRGDPLTHPDVFPMIDTLKSKGIASIELRTDLVDLIVNSTATPEQIIESGIDVLSVDVLANSRSLYEVMTGVDGFERLLDVMQSLFSARNNQASDISGSLPRPWILPRMTRCDAVYADIESFYDRWLTVCGCATIDAPLCAEASDRIQALKVPRDRQEQLDNQILRIASNGRVVDAHRRPIGSINAFELGVHEAYTQLRRVHDHAASVEPKSHITPAGAGA
ncbi:MAG: 6-hydroxymethylpterin diphosphokinase MptE-like protein [Phycisphaerales bacterium]